MTAKKTHSKFIFWTRRVEAAAAAAAAAANADPDRDRDANAHANSDSDATHCDTSHSLLMPLCKSRSHTSPAAF